MLLALQVCQIYEGDAQYQALWVNVVFNGIQSFIITSNLSIIMNFLLIILLGVGWLQLVLLFNYSENVSSIIKTDYITCAL